MARYHFDTTRDYAAKLLRVVDRPIENKTSPEVSLIRLEFAIYWVVERHVLESRGEIACRDIVVSRALPIVRDAGLTAYATALCVPGDAGKTSNWRNLAVSDRWIALRFGKAESAGERNAFEKIARFDPKGWKIKEYRYDLNEKWGGIGAVAASFSVSESTARRRVAELEAEWGNRLVVRTDGRHRRINLELLSNLWDSDTR